jgi:hypothetical protein
VSEEVVGVPLVFGANLLEEADDVLRDAVGISVGLLDSLWSVVKT